MNEEETRLAEQRTRIAFHEASHALVAYVLRQPIRLVSVRPGETFLGIMVHALSAPIDVSKFRLELPGIAQPAALRRRVEAEICTSLAGEIGAQLVWLRPGYFERSMDEPEAAAAALEFAGLSRADAEHLAALERDPTPIPLDEEHAQTKAYALAGEEGWALLSYLRPITKRIVWSHHQSVAALASELLEREVVSGRWVRKFLRERGVRQW